MPANMTRHRADRAEAQRNVPFNMRGGKKRIPVPATQRLYERHVGAREEKLKQLLEYLHDPQLWFTCWRKHTAMAERANLRKMVQIQTIDCLLRGSYYLPNGSQIDIPRKDVVRGIQQCTIVEAHPTNESMTAPPPANDAPTQAQSSSTGSAPIAMPGRGVAGGAKLSTSPGAFAPSRSPPAHVGSAGSAGGLLGTSPGAAPGVGAAEGTADTQIYLVRDDILRTALWLQAEGKSRRVCIVNPASSSNAGGGYRGGSSGLEEGLCRRTSLAACLEDPWGWNPGSRTWTYPIPEFGAIYTPSVVVFRDSEHAGYAFLPKPHVVGVVSTSAYASPPTEEQSDGSSRLPHKEAELTTRKIYNTLRVAHKRGHDAVVIPAWGCGVYGNPSEHIALLFRKVLAEHFKNAFKVVAFSVVDPQHWENFTNAFTGSKAFTLFGEENIQVLPHVPGPVTYFAAAEAMATAAVDGDEDEVAKLTAAASSVAAGTEPAAPRGGSPWEEEAPGPGELAIVANALARIAAFNKQKGIVAPPAANKSEEEPDGEDETDGEGAGEDEEEGDE